MVGLVKVVRVFLDFIKLSKIFRIGISNVVIVMLSVLVSYKIVINMSNVKFLLVLGVKGKVFKRIKKSIILVIKIRLLWVFIFLIEFRLVFIKFFIVK